MEAAMGAAAAVAPEEMPAARWRRQQRWAEIAAEALASGTAATTAKMTAEAEAVAVAAEAEVPGCVGWREDGGGVGDGHGGRGGDFDDGES